MSKLERGLASARFVAEFTQLNKHQGAKIIVLGGRRIDGVTDIPNDFSEYVHRSVDASSESSASEPLAVLAVPSLRSFYEVAGDVQEPPSSWIRGISTFYPDRNAMSGMSGSSEDRAYITRNRTARARLAVPPSDLIADIGSVCWHIDLEGADAEVVRYILLRGPPPLILFEHALISSTDHAKVLALALDLGLGFVCDDEDTCLFRQVQ